MSNVMIGGIDPKKIKYRTTKSKAASRVLRLMDEEYSYQEALRIALRENRGLSKKALEKELDRYI